MRVVYLLQFFPRSSSQTFIVNEMAELKNNGMDVNIVAFGKQLTTHGLINESGLLDKAHYLYNSENRIARIIKAIKNATLQLVLHPSRFVDTFIYMFFEKKISISYILHSYVFLCSIPKTDFLHIPFPEKLFITLAEINKKFNKTPFTLTYRAGDIYDQGFARGFSKDAAEIITISKYNKNFLRKFYSEKYSIPIIHSSIDCQKFITNNKKNRSSNNIIVTVGRFVEKKGIYFLIEACRICSVRNIKFKCFIIGDGHLKDKYISQINKCNLQKQIKILDTFSQENVKKILNIANIFVLPCIIDKNNDRDILPNVLKEAMAMEVPTLTTNIAGIEELIQNNYNGYLIEEKNSLEIADKIEWILKNPWLSKDIAKNGRETIIKFFNIKNEALKMKEIFQSIKN